MFTDVLDAFGAEYARNDAAFFRYLNFLQVGFKGAFCFLLRKRIVLTKLRVFSAVFTFRHESIPSAKLVDLSPEIGAIPYHNARLTARVAQERKLHDDKRERSWNN